MKKSLKAMLFLLVSLMLLVSLAACGMREQENPKTTGEAMETAESKGDVWQEALYKEDTSFGSGQKEVKVKVRVKENSVTFTLLTDEENLADALLEHKLVEGEDGPFGLYIKKVNGILADYDVDQSYWSLEQNGAALMSGASDTKISHGETYELVYTK